MFILQVGESVVGLAGHDYTDETRKRSTKHKKSNQSKHKPKHKPKPTPKPDLTMAFEPCEEFCGAL